MTGGRVAEWQSGSKGVGKNRLLLIAIRLLLASYRAGVSVVVKMHSNLLLECVLRFFQREMFDL